MAALGKWTKKTGVLNNCFIYTAYRGEWKLTRSLLVTKNLFLYLNQHHLGHIPYPENLHLATRETFDEHRCLAPNMCCTCILDNVESRTTETSSTSSIPMACSFLK